MRELRGSGLTVGDAGKWFVATDRFTDGGGKVSGPFSTRNDAIAARESIEQLSGNLTYWVDQAPLTLIYVKS